MEVLKGYIEAATVFGFTRGQTFRWIMFPVMMRYTLPGIGNNWQVILKATALSVAVGLGRGRQSHAACRKVLESLSIHHGLWAYLLVGIHHPMVSCSYLSVIIP